MQLNEQLALNATASVEHSVESIISDGNIDTPLDALCSSMENNLLRTAGKPTFIPYLLCYLLIEFVVQKCLVSMIDQIQSTCRLPTAINLMQLHSTR